MFLVCGLKRFCQALQHGNDNPGEFKPGLELFESDSLKLALFTRFIKHARFKTREAFLSAVEMRLDLFPKESRGEPTQFRFGDKVIAAISLHVDRLCGAHIPQPAQPLARRTLADFEAIHDLIERQGMVGAEQESINFPDGFWQGKHGGSTHEEFDAFALERR